MLTVSVLCEYGDQREVAAHDLKTEDYFEALDWLSFYLGMHGFGTKAKLTSDGLELARLEGR